VTPRFADPAAYAANALYPSAIRFADSPVTVSHLVTGDLATVSATDDNWLSQRWRRCNRSYVQRVGASQTFPGQ
jgi:hypothetical protein